MCSTKIFFATIFNEIKFHVKTSLGLVGGDASPPVSAPVCMVCVLETNLCFAI